ncbi:MAG: hypothetical protein J6S47_01575 [Eubacteriaceae bacterium]|nr:hypothetical protein [Eubacteriaceae bacterium]
MLQRRFAGFSTDVPPGVRVSRSAVGIPFFYAVDLIIAPAVSGLIGGAAGAFMTLFIPVFFVTFIYPWCFSRAEARGENRDAPVRNNIS